MCSGMEEVRQEAIQSVHDLAIDALSRGESPEAICIEVHDCRHGIVMALGAREALTKPSRPNFKAMCSVKSRGTEH